MTEQGADEYGSRLAKAAVIVATGLCLGRDYVKAVEWYEKAANQGNADAQHTLGLLYYLGESVGRDYVQAAQWYEKAASQGNADAQYNLGMMYYHGEGVIHDREKSCGLWKMSAEQNDESATEAYERYCSD